MHNHQFQQGIFSASGSRSGSQPSSQSRQALELPDADIEYWQNFLNPEQAQRLYQHILDNIKLSQHRVVVYGKAHLTPRLVCWMGDAGLHYHYAKHTLRPVRWDAQLLACKTRLERASRSGFNSVLINYYRDGRDSNGWHSDDEPELGRHPTIASLSLGATRDFQLRHKTQGELKQTLALQAGSVLLMRGATQGYWQHQIPKRAHVGGRINLTFRQIVNNGGLY